MGAVLLLWWYYLLGWFNGYGVLLWDGDLHGFGGVVLGGVALEGSSKLSESGLALLRRGRFCDPGRWHYGCDTPSP